MQMKNCSFLEPLISPSKIVLFEKLYHLKVRQKYSAAHRIFNSLLSVSCNISNMRRSVLSPDETPRRELKI